MKLDKLSLIEYDYKVYNDKYHEIKDAFNDGKSVDNLSSWSMKEWSEKGIFCRRLKFQKKEENFYITTASISRGVEYNHDLQFGENYIIPYWGDQDQRARALMEFDIGEKSPVNGKLELIGDFKPFQDNLLSITYKTQYTKEYIKDAKLFLSGKEENDTLYQKINIDTFFRLRFELASQGIQAKALYDMNNSIIDGSAGTGKSTIAIQKLKFISERNISQNKLLIIVKNLNLKYHFRTLLSDKEIGLSDVQIETIENIFDVHFDDTLDYLIDKANKLKELLYKKIQNKDIQSLDEHYINLIGFIGIDFIKEKIKELCESELSSNKKEIINLEQEKEKIIVEKNNYIGDIKNDKDNIYIKLKDENISNISKKECKDEINLIDEELKNYQNNSMKFDEDIKKIQKKIDVLSGEKYNKALDSLLKNKIISLVVLTDLVRYLSNTKHYKNIEVLKWIVEYKNFLMMQQSLQEKLDKLKKEKQKNLEEKEKVIIENEIINLEQELTKKYKESDKRYIDTYKKVMEIVYFSKKYLEEKRLVDNDLIYKLLNIGEKEFDTIIVDEAQDFSKYELEIIRLHTKRIILTGDILQNIDSSRGLSDWNELLALDEYKKDNDKLNKFSLKHNFRQTYQLANASYNYRQLLLDEGLDDIGYDYFENEKSFNGKEYARPKLTYIENKLKLIEFIEDKFKEIADLYTERFPLIIVYKNTAEYDNYKNILRGYDIANNKNSTTSDIILLSLDQIKGDQFPLVIADMSSFEEKELYLIMTRAQFELELFITKYKNFNQKILQLIKNTEKINFIKLENIDLNKIQIFKQQKSVEPSLVPIGNSNNVDFQCEKKKAPRQTEQNKKINNNKNIDKVANNSFTTFEQIQKHQAEIFQYDEELDIDIITDEEDYQKKFIQQVEEEIKELDSVSQNEVLKEIIVVKKVSTSKKDKELKEKIRLYLADTYKGYCQICGFTFRKVGDGKNSFEMFTWNDKRVVQQKKSFITTADSLCLCRNCSANIKWGAFEPIFIDKINQIEDFFHKNSNKIKELICAEIEENILNKFQDSYEWNDIYALEIMVNEEIKHIYITNGHLIQLIAYMKFEKEKVI